VPFRGGSEWQQRRIDDLPKELLGKGRRPRGRRMGMSCRNGLQKKPETSCWRFWIGYVEEAEKGQKENCTGTAVKAAEGRAKIRLLNNVEGVESHNAVGQVYCPGRYMTRAKKTQRNTKEYNATHPMMRRNQPAQESAEEHSRHYLLGRPTKLQRQKE